MSEPFLGQIEVFAFNYAPRGWAQCNGQSLPITQNQALYALLGVQFGGDGRTSFNLPDLRGRVVNGTGTIQATTYAMGQKVGSETVELTTATVPPHTHPLNAVNNGTSNGSGSPSPSVLLGSGYNPAGSGSPTPVYVDQAATPQVAVETLTTAGGNMPHENRMPYMPMNYCICLQGIFPSRS